DCRPGPRWPRPTVRVADSPPPSAVRIAARRVGAVKKAAAACYWWCSVKRIFAPGTPRWEAMIPFTHSFSPSEFFIARGKLRQERGKARRMLERIRSNFSIGFLVQYT